MVRFTDIKAGMTIRHNGVVAKVLERTRGQLKVEPLGQDNARPVWIVDANWYFERGELEVVYDTLEKAKEVATRMEVKMVDQRKRVREVEHRIAELERERDEARRERDVLLARVEKAERIEVELRTAHIKTCVEVEQTLGKALGYPWYKDNQKSFPGATEADGVCVAEHVPETLVEEAAQRITRLERERDEARDLAAEYRDRLRLPKTLPWEEEDEL